MLLHSSALLLASFTMLVYSCIVSGDDLSSYQKDMRQARKWIQVSSSDGGDGKSYEYLIRMGERAFPAYEAILSDPKAPSHDIAKVFDVLSSVETDRRRFIKNTVDHLTDADSRTRVNALHLLRDIGSPAEASILVALLSHDDAKTATHAAWVLAAIGGPNEVVAMDVWLRGVSSRHNPKIRQEVRQYRDKLKERLDDAKDPEKRAQQRRQAWKDLANDDTGEAVVKAHDAVRELSAGGTETIAFFKDHLRAVSAETQKHIEQFLADLDSDSFDRREAASRELARGVVARAILQNALVNRPSVEMRRRLEAILEDMPDWSAKDGEFIRQFRAVWVLQQIGTPEARALLEKLAAGAPSAALTQKAKDALQSLDRLKKR